MRKVAGEGDKLRQLGNLIKRLRRPGIVYCATVRAVDDLYVALRHGKIPVERYNGKMTTAERETSQASFMQAGRKVVMMATNAFGLGIDKPDIRYIIHYQMPGSPEAYVQEAGRAGRDGKPARCVLLFQPDDIAIQEHFLKEAHPTKSQARMVAEGLYAWSDEGKEVSVRDLAMSLALPERRVRVILSVLEAMGVAKEVKAARWEGVEPKPTREQIDKAASVFEARRISDRRRLASLLRYMNTQRCRVQMMRAYFGEPEGDKCGLCDSCAGLDSEVFDTAGRRAARAARRDRLPRAPAAAPAGTRRLGHAGDPRSSAARADAARAASSRRRFRPICFRRWRRTRSRVALRRESSFDARVWATLDEPAPPLLRARRCTTRRRMARRDHSARRGSRRVNGVEVRPAPTDSTSRSPRVPTPSATCPRGPPCATPTFARTSNGAPAAISRCPCCWCARQRRRPEPQRPSRPPAARSKRPPPGHSANGGGGDGGGNGGGGNDRGRRRSAARPRPIVRTATAAIDRDRGPRIPGVYNPGGD